MPQSLVYRRPHGKDPGFGKAEDIRKGDAVSYYYRGAVRSARVEKLSIPARRLRTNAHLYGKKVLRPAVTLLFEDVISAYRKDEPEEPTTSSDPGAE